MFYKKSILVIDGKKRNNDGMSIGKNNNNASMMTGRVCFSLMARSKCASMGTQEKKKVSSGGISTESVSVPKLGRRSVSDHWIPF